MPIHPKCCEFLESHATGTWHESYCLINKNEDTFIHTIQRNTIVLRVELNKKRAFYWFYNTRDAIAFNEFVSFKLRTEAHEIIITNRCRLFYDIDLKLNEFEKNELAERFGIYINEYNQIEVMEYIAMRFAEVFKNATIFSLEEHGIYEDEYLKNFDWMATMRNRPLQDDGFKISIHLITNIMAPVKVCAAIIKNVKHEIIQKNHKYLDIDDYIADMLCNSIDANPCKFRGSLSLPFGTKQTETGEYHNIIKQDYDIPNQRFFLTIEDQYVIGDLDFGQYNVECNLPNSDPPDSEFVSRALQHLNNIPDYSEDVWDIKSSLLKKSFMYVKRRRPSNCSLCERVHDNDNTLFLAFNSALKIASWKCTHNEAKLQVFYKEYPSRKYNFVTSFGSAEPIDNAAERNYESDVDSEEDEEIKKPSYDFRI